MEIGSTTGALTGNDTSSGAAASRLSDDFDNFLLLLTTQLQNQDPLEPLDTHEFTNQLVQFANVEQSIESNTHLESLVSGQNNNLQVQALSYLGNEVNASGERMLLKDGTAEFQYVSDKNYSRSEVEIYNEAGTKVNTLQVPNSAGIQTAQWDGRDENGNRLAEGFYKVKVNGFDLQGNATPLDTVITGDVSSVGVENGKIMLTVGGIAISADDVIAFNTPQQN